MSNDASLNIANAFVLYESGNLDGAAEILEQLLHVTQEVFTQDDTTALLTIAKLSFKLNQDQQSARVSLFRKLYAVTSCGLGADHQVTLSAGLNFVSLLQHENEIDEAEKIAQQLLSTSEETLGSNNEITVHCAMALLGVYAQKNDIVAGQMLMARVPGLMELLIKGFSGE